MFMITPSMHFRWIGLVTKKMTIGYILLVYD